MNSHPCLDIEYNAARPRGLELIEQAYEIRKQWIDCFTITTARRASMTANLELARG
jgi:hypothetical protein